MNPSGARDTAGACDDRRAYLSEVCELLWPYPATVSLSGGPGPGRRGRASQRVAEARGNGAGGVPTGVTGPARPMDREFFVLPGMRRPRVLVPLEPRAASAAVRRYGEPGSRTTRLGARVLSLALASGLGGAVLRGRMRVHATPGSETIESYLRSVLTGDIRVSMHLRPARANRKPVLQLLTRDGEPVGFAKLGVNPLTRSLVRAEHDALARLARASLVDVMAPRVLHYGEWCGLDVLVLSALPVWLRRRPIAADRLAAAMAEVARVDGLRRGILAEGAYWMRLRGRLAATDEGAERAALSESLDALAARAGQTSLRYGAWHGDWTPWNMASTARGPLLWDWERFTSGVPLGFDALHYRLQSDVVPRCLEPRAAAAACIQHAPQLLAPFEVAAPQARVTAILYLADLATRYLADRQAKAGAPLGAPREWLIPAIAGQVARL